jgi:hypothetical protein
VNGNDPSPGLALGALPGVRLEPDPASINAADLVDAVHDEFQRQGEIPPPPDKVLVIARVVTGHLRTCPLPDAASPQGQAIAVASFVGACPAWWTHDYREYGRLAALLDDVFRQREVGIPPPAAMDTLLGLVAGIMRRKQLPRSESAQLALADWIASLYLAGLDEW